MTQVEILKEVYAALNRNDIPRVFEFFDPEIERIEFTDLPMGGTYRGHADVYAHFKKGRETWAEGGCHPERFVVAGDKVVVLVHVRVRQKDKMEWIDGRVADGFAFRDGKVVQFRSFLKNKDAFEWAGIQEAH